MKFNRRIFIIKKFVDFLINKCYHKHDLSILVMKAGKNSMEQVINQLYEIEAAAVKIMEDISDKKKELADSTEKKIKRFEDNLQDETSKKLEVYANELNQQSAAKLKQLEEHTKELMKSMDDAYTGYHSEIAKHLFDSIIKECF